MHFPSFIMLISSARLKHFLPQSSSKRLFHDASGGTFRIIIAYQESIIASFEDVWQSELSQNVDRH